MLLLNYKYSNLQSVLIFDIHYLLTQSFKMPLLLLNVSQKYLLECELDNNFISVKFCQEKLTSVPSYTYVTKFNDKNMDPKLEFIFASIENIWRYLNFYREKALVVDYGRV